MALKLKVMTIINNKLFKGHFIRQESDYIMNVTKEEMVK